MSRNHTVGQYSSLNTGAISGMRGVATRVIEVVDVVQAASIAMAVGIAAHGNIEAPNDVALAHKRTDLSGAEEIMPTESVSEYTHRDDAAIVQQAIRAGATPPRNITKPGM